MSNITRLPGTPDSRRRYQAGDITSALAEGLRHEDIAGQIEQALEQLIFVAGPEDILAARELLSDLLDALPEPQTVTSQENELIDASTAGFDCPTCGRSVTAFLYISRTEYQCDECDYGIIDIHEDYITGKVPEVVEGVPVNPVLPPHFDQCDNSERPDSHREWFNRPYIITDDSPRESYDAVLRRMAGYIKAGTFEPGTRAEWDAKQDAEHAGWLKHFPSGVRYDVRCLDGGAWDRPTGWGMVGTLEEAIHIAKNGPSWQRQT